VPPDLTGADAMGTGPGEGSTGAPPDDSTRSVRDSSTRTAASVAAIATVPTRVDSTVAEAGFVVQFAALLDRQSAEALASGIRVDGRQARISTTQRDGRALYRVVLGPYATRAQAERAGRAAGVSFWISEGTP
jgi:cell division protein FtsN